MINGYSILIQLCSIYYLRRICRRARSMIEKAICGFLEERNSRAASKALAVWSSTTVLYVVLYILVRCHCRFKTAHSHCTERTHPSIHIAMILHVQYVELLMYSDVHFTLYSTVSVCLCLYLSGLYSTLYVHVRTVMNYVERTVVYSMLHLCKVYSYFPFNIGLVWYQIRVTF